MVVVWVINILMVIIAEVYCVVGCRELKHGGGSEQAEGAKC